MRYDQGKTDQSTESTPSQSTLPGTSVGTSGPAVKGNSASIKARFEQQGNSPSSQPPPARPAPGRVQGKVSVPPPQGGAPPPARPPTTTPPVAKLPLPEPEPAYEETPVEPYEETPVEPYEETPVEAYEEPSYPDAPYPASTNDSEETSQEKANQGEYVGEQYDYSEQPVGEQYEGGDYAQEQTSSSGITAKALYDYDAENPDDLSFKEGDTLIVLDQSDPSGWWEGELNGKSGFFPSNFVELAQ